MSQGTVKSSFHIGLNSDDVKDVSVAIIPGDPGRVPKIAHYLEQAKPMANHREFCSMKGQYQGQNVLVISTGIGGPSAAICIEELAMLGIKRFLRVGTTGAIQDHIEPGDIIVPTAAVRLDGASSHIAPLAFPAVADFSMVHSIREALIEKNCPASSRHLRIERYILSRAIASRLLSKRLRPSRDASSL